MDDSSHGVIAIRAENSLPRLDRTDPSSLRPLASASMGHRTPPGVGANQRRGRAYGRAADRAPCRRTAVESDRRPAAPKQFMSGTVRAQ
jgi:hypothetical protein